VSWLALALAALVAVFAAREALARPGGGQSYRAPSHASTPSHSSPSFPSHGGTPSTSPSTSPSTDPTTGQPVTGSFLPFFIFVALFVGVALLVSRRQSGLHEPTWDAAARHDAPRAAASPGSPSYPSLVAALTTLRTTDPEFSFVLFEDFLYALYAEAHMARGKHALATLSPYLAPGARGALEALGANAVRTVIVGGMRVESVAVGEAGAPTSVVAVFDANYAEVDAQGAEHAFYASERWTLTRPAGAKSRPPARARAIDCPCCGAPLDKVIGGVCGYCKQNVETGDRDWTVSSIEVLSREARSPILLADAEDEPPPGPTIVGPDVQARWAALTARDPALDWRAFSARVGLVYQAFHEAWTGRDALRVRPYLSDNLFQAQVYWIEAYKREHLVNRTDGAHIVSLNLCRVVSDARFDAITVRVFATGRDYTVDEAGALKAGNKDGDHSYSEYWTLIRGVDRTGPPRTTPTCPSCGAALDVNMAGGCAYCHANVASGEFDWVLSRIEQDAAYTG
jgi:predicted lipid-binding transport protein (Tim44 family)